MMSRRTDTTKLDADAADVLARFRAGRLALTEIMRTYHLAWSAINRWLIQHGIGVDERAAALAILRRLRVNSGAWRPGHVPWDKGSHFVAGGRSALTRFKPGCIRGVAARRLKAVGAITIRADRGPRSRRGRPRKSRTMRRWIKVRDDGPIHGRWIEYARYVWQRDHGPIPPGGRIVHFDGDALNDAPGNLMLTDAAGNLAHLYARRPDLRAKRLRTAAIAARQRWGRLRVEREGRAAMTARDREMAWCDACGWSSDGMPLDGRCPKCRATATMTKVRSCAGEAA